MAVIARKECRAHPGYWCPSHAHDEPHAPHNPQPKKLRRQRNRPEFRLARMLSVILDEDQDNVDEPHAVRIEQASHLLSLWSSAQGSLRGAFMEILNLKAGYCIRCPEGFSPEAPCAVCGRKEPFDL